MGQALGAFRRRSMGAKWLSCKGLNLDYSVMNNCVHVAVAAIVVDGQVLLAKRPDHLHQGGLWEFPGGKLEPGETVCQALVRELKEELDIDIRPTRPLIAINHDYGDKKVFLDVWVVNDYKGVPRGCEGQEIEWLPINDLRKKAFPAANQAIISALSLPELYLISPEPNTISPEPNAETFSEFKSQFENAVKSGITLVQFRAKKLNISSYFEWARELGDIAVSYKAKLILNTSPDDFLIHAKDMNIAGLHLSSKHLLNSEQRPIGKDKLLGASCHNLREVQHAHAIDVDYITLSPIKTTMSHPDAQPLGIETFKAVVSEINKPVYALGGLGREDLGEVLLNGGQGVAAIRKLWF